MINGANEHTSESAMSHPASHSGGPRAAPCINLELAMHNTRSATDRVYLRSHPASASASRASGSLRIREAPVPEAQVTEKAHETLSGCPSYLHPYDPSTPASETQEAENAFGSVHLDASSGIDMSHLSHPGGNCLGIINSEHDGSSHCSGRPRVATRIGDDIDPPRRVRRRIFVKTTPVPP
jgi:hypothetical protein